VRSYAPHRHEELSHRRNWIATLPSLTAPEDLRSTGAAIELRHTALRNTIQIVLSHGILGLSEKKRFFLIAVVLAPGGASVLSASSQAWSLKAHFGSRRLCETSKHTLAWNQKID
jgi:hypothetical protein